MDIAEPVARSDMGNLARFNLAARDLTFLLMYAISQPER